MRKSTLRLYLPFLALIAAQALLVAFLPSQGAKNGQQVAAKAFSAGDNSIAAAGGDASGAAGGAVDNTISGGGGAVGGAAGTAKGAAKSALGFAAGDTTHCVGNKQFHIIANATPPCVPAFVGDNGGVTYQGVTKDKITVVFFSSKPNDQVDTILATQGLSVPGPESDAFTDMAVRFIEKHYELYGRKINIVHFQGNCPTTPPDYDACNSEAQTVIDTYHPFLIVWGTPLYGSVFDIWARAKIPSLGGWQFDDSLFNTRRPYRYDPWMNGTEVGSHIAEYYCKKMAHGKADHSGSVIHATIGNRGKVDRKLGIITPEIEANTLAAKRVIKAVQACGGNVTGTPYTYVSDITTATQQTATTVSKLISDKVTTVACMCDPIAPVFLTEGMTGANYFPEIFITGTQFLDADLVGRLYDSQQMQHAFGVSTIPAQVALTKADATLVWKDMGSPAAAAKDASATNPCEKNGCGINWSYVNMLGTGLQMAGPKLTPESFEKGLLTMPADGGWSAVGRPDVGLWKLGANDYTWLSDVREVYFSGAAISPVDNQPCAYVGLNGGKRYTLGQWAGDLSQIPVDAPICAKGQG